MPVPQPSPLRGKLGSHRISESASGISNDLTETLSSPSRWYKSQPRRRFGLPSQGTSAPPAGGPGRRESGPTLTYRDLSPTRTRHGPATALGVSGLISSDSHLNGDYVIEETGRFVQIDGIGVLSHKAGRWRLGAGQEQHTCSSSGLLGQWQHDAHDQTRPIAYPFIVATRTRDMEKDSRPHEPHFASHHPPETDFEQEERKRTERHMEEARARLERQLEESRRELEGAQGSVEEAVGRVAAGERERDALARQLLEAAQGEARAAILFEEAEDLSSALFWLGVPLHRFTEAALMAARSERAAHEGTAAELAQHLQTNQSLLAERAAWVQQIDAERDAQHKTALGAEHLAREMETWRNDVKDTLQEEEMQTQAKLHEANLARDEARRHADLAEGQVQQLVSQLDASRLRADQLEQERQGVISELRSQLLEMRQAAARETQVREELLNELTESRREAQQANQLFRENISSRLDLLVVTAKLPLTDKDLTPDAAVLASRLDAITTSLAQRMHEMEEDLANSSICVKQLAARVSELEEHNNDLQTNLDVTIRERNVLSTENEEQRNRLQLLESEATALRHGKEAAEAKSARLEQDNVQLVEELRVARVEEGVVRRLAEQVRVIEADMRAQAAEQVQAEREEHSLEKARLMTRLHDAEAQLAVYAQQQQQQQQPQAEAQSKQLSPPRETHRARMHAAGPGVSVQPAQTVQPAPSIWATAPAAVGSYGSRSVSPSLARVQYQGGGGGVRGGLAPSHSASHVPETRHSMQDWLTSLR